MLYYCEYTWHSHTTVDKVRARIIEQDDMAGEKVRQATRGWYQLAGGGAGFLLLETQSPQEVTAVLQPYMDLMAWDIRAIYEMPYEETVRNFRSMAQGGSR